MRHARHNPSVLARGRPPAAREVSQGGLSGPTGRVVPQPQNRSSGQGLGVPVRPAAQQGPSGLGTPVATTGDIDLMVTGTRFPAGDRVIVDLEADTTPYAFTCYPFYVALVSGDESTVIDTHLEGRVYGTCYHRWQMAGTLPQGVDSAKILLWWANRFRGWFQTSPPFEEAIGDPLSGDPAPSLKSDTFPLLETQEGRERGIYEEETKPTVGSIADFGSEVGDQIQSVLIWGTVLVGGGALLYYGGPILTAASEQAAKSIEGEPGQENSSQENSSQDDSGQEGSGPEALPEGGGPQAREESAGEERENPGQRPVIRAESILRD